jgi:hypothetical protein
VVTVMQAAEAALRAQGLQRSADDFHMLLTTFFAAQRQAGILEGEAECRPAQPQSRPTLAKQGRSPRRIPGLARKLR